MDDTRLKLSVYLSYAYEHSVWVGQKVSVSVPRGMSTLDGAVENDQFTCAASRPKAGFV